ncbi:MAG TPA: tRNA (N6-isopentenyl adenosine(37)-C2)-methylthiotransferase MiaB [Kiritimatiellia bacterium]|nr:tRNA (N6-isopentenyl adenosine(37)-C2)-methylthiotransferase MiaB [Kiritimatiellia bacterium]
MRFILHTYGCQMNVRDSEAVTALLEAAGHTQAACEDEADLIVVNSCSVRAKAEDKALGKLGLLCASKRERPNRLVGLMGCMAQRMGAEIFTRVPGLDFAVGTRRAGAIPRLVARAQNGETGLLETADPDEIPDVIAAHADAGFSAFVTILLGCNRRCAYCIVPDVRGSEYSRPAREILAEVRALVRNGVREVTLLGQSVMNYGRTNPVWDASDEPSPGGFTEPFARLLEAVANVPGLARVRFTSGHPSGVTDQLVRACASLPAVCHHLHLPVQSGSDRILARMRRGYSRADYLDAVRRLRAAMPDFALTTDVIVGFPGETADDFEATRSLMNEADFDNAFIFKYSPRPGTPAADWEDDVTDAEKMRRNQVLLEDQDLRGAAANSRLIGTVQEVLAEGPSLRNAVRWSGRSPGNKIVIFEPIPGITASTLVRVRITRAAPQTLYGDVVPC